MDGAYLPQHVRQARRDGRLLGQVRDLLSYVKPLHAREETATPILFMQETPNCIEVSWGRLGLISTFFR